MSDSQIAAALGSVSRGSLPVGHPGILESRGEIHECRRLRLTDGRSVFVKYAKTVETGQMLREEATGLIRLGAHVRVPKILAQSEGEDGRAWLAVEWLQLLKMENAEFMDLGRQLAVLHGVTRERYGLSRCNFLGTVPQDNTPSDNWLEFFIDRRLRPQLHYLRSKGNPQPEAEILDAAESLLRDHNPRPALLHGNLSYWNVGPIAGSKTVFFDPAPYHGDPEIDLVRLGWYHSTCCGAFLIGYGDLPDGYRLRRPLYELYHALIRVNAYRGAYPQYGGLRLQRLVRELLDAAKMPR